MISNENENLTQTEIDILFLKSATQNQKSQIICKHKCISIQKKILFKY